MKLLPKIGGVLVAMAAFGYLAYVMYHFDDLTGRQYRLVILIASFMVGIFGKTVAAIITAVLGLALGCFALLSKDDEEDDDKIIPTKVV